MDAFKVRLINEQFELQEKIEKLKSFTQSENFSKVAPEQQELLKEQLRHMVEYNRVLIKRLNLLGVA